MVILPIHGAPSPKWCCGTADVESASVATGVGQVLGNKGAVGICFDFGSTSLLFVNCHLSGMLRLESPSVSHRFKAGAVGLICRNSRPEQRAQAER